MTISAAINQGKDILEFASMSVTHFPQVPIVGRHKRKPEDKDDGSDSGHQDVYHKKKLAKLRPLKLEWNSVWQATKHQKAKKSYIEVFSTLWP